MTAQQEANKALVMELLNKAFNEKNPQAAAELLTDRYIQHSPTVPTGKEGFLQGVPGVHAMFPNLKIDIKHIWADGDYVITHSHYQFTPEGQGMAIVDMFRIENGKVDEHW